MSSTKTRRPRPSSTAHRPAPWPLALAARAATLARRRARWPLAMAALAATLAGCPSTSPADRCPRLLYSGVAAGTVTLRDERGTVWADGTEVPLVFGAQGGYMITPVLEIDGALADGERPCLRVTLEHRDPGGLPIFDEFRFRETNEDFVRTIDGDLATDAIFDQLRWTPLPSGTPVEVTATVRGESFAARGVVTLRLVPEP